MRLIAVLVALAFCQLTAAVLFGESGGPVASAHNALTRGKQMLAAWIHPSKGVALRKGAPRNQSPISLLGCMTCDTGVVDPKSNKHIRESSKKLDAEANSWANRASASDEHSLYLYGSRTGSRKSSTSSSPHSRRRDGSGKGVGRTDHLLLAQSRPGSPIPSRHDPHINNIFLGNSYWGRQSLATPPKSVWGSPGSPTGPLRNEVGKQVFRSKSFKPATSFSFQPEVSSLSHDAHEPGSTSPDLTHFKRSGRKKTDLTPLNVPKRSEEIQRRRVQIEAIMPISTEMTLMKRSSHGQVAFMMQNNLQRRLLKSGYAKAKKVLRAVGNMGCTGCGKAWSPQPSVADHYWRLGSASFSDATRSRHSRSVSFSDMSTSLKESSLTPKDLPHLRNGGQISPSRLMQESPPRQPPNENFDDPEQWNRVWKWIPRPPAAKPAEPVPKTVVESIPLPLLPPRAPPKKFKRTSSAAGSASTVHPTTKTPPSSISDLIKRGLTENLFKLCKGCTRPSAAEESSLAPLSAAHSDSPAFRRLTSEHMSRMQHWTEHGRQPLRERPLQTETEDLRLSEVPGPMSMRAKKTAIAAWARRQGKLPRLAGGGTQERPWAEENLGHDRPVFDPWLLSPERRPPELEPGHTSQQHSFDTPRALSPTRLSDAGEGSRGGEASRHKTNDPSAASVRSSTLSGQNSLTALEAAFRKAEGRANKSPEKGTRATSARRLAERTRDHRLAKRDLRSDQVLQKRFLGKLFSCFGGCKSSSPKFPKIPAGATDAEVKKFAGSLLGKTSTISGTRHRTHRRAHSLQILQKRLSRSLFACFGLCKAPLPPRMPQIRTTEAELLKVAADRKPHGAISSSHLAHAERRDIVHILHRRFLKALFSCFMCKSGDSPRFPSIPKGATDADVKRIAGSMLGKTSTISGTRHRTHRRGIQVNELEVTADRAEKRGENGQTPILQRAHSDFLQRRMRVPNVPDDLEAEAEKRARLVTNNSSLSRLFRSASSAAQDGASTPQQVEHAVRKSESGTSIHHATRSTSSLENVHNDNGQSYGLWRSLSTRLFGGPPQNRRLRSIGVTPTGERQARRQAALKDRRAAIAQSRRGANIHPQTHTPHTTSTIASSSTLEDSTPAAQGTYARQHVAERISLDSSVPRRRLHDERGDSHIDRFTSRSRYENELSGHTKIDETMQRSRAGGVSVKDLTDQDGETASHMADRRLERRSQHIWSTLERRFTPDEVERLRRMTSGINRLGESSSSSMTRSRSSAQGQNYDGHTSPAGSLTRIHQNSYPSRLQTTTQAYTPGLGWFAHRTSSATARDRRHGAVAAAVGAQVDRSRQQELDRLNHLDSGFSHPDHEYPRFRSDADIAALHGWHHTPSTSRSPIAPDSPQSGRRASSSSTPYERLMASHGGRHGEPHTVSTSSTQTESGNLRPNRGASPGSGSTPYERLMASYGESSVHSIHRGQEQLRENARPVTRHGRPKMDLDSHDVPHHQEEDDGRMEGQLHPAAWRVDEMTGDSANDIHHEMAHGVRAERHPDFVHKPGATGWALSKHRLSRRNSGDDIARVKGEDGRRDFSSSQAKLALEKRGLLGELFGCFRSSSGCGVGSYSRKAQQPHTPGPSEPGFPKPAEWARAELHTGDVPRRLEPQKSFDVKGLPMYAKLQQWRAEESAALGKGKATMPSSSHSPPRASLAEASHGEWRDDPDTMIVHKDSLRERTSTSQRRALPSEQAGSSAPTHTRRPSFDPDSIYIHKSMLPEVPHNLAGDPRMMLHSGSLRQLQGSSSGRRSFSRSSSRSSRGG